MSHCCITAATAAAVLTALIVVVLTAYVLAADGFGLGVLLSTTLAVVLQRLQWIGPYQRLLFAFSILLAVRDVAAGDDAAVAEPIELNR